MSETHGELTTQQIDVYIFPKHLGEKGGLRPPVLSASAELYVSVSNCQTL